MKQSNHRSPKKWVHIGLLILVLGFLIFILGAAPGLFNLNRSPAVGFAQSATFAFGLAVLCLGGFISLRASRGPAYQQSLVEDIGYRLVGTGYLISFVSALADVFGFGTQTLPAPPFLGPSQAAGVVIGEIIIAIGFVMSIPRRDASPNSQEKSNTTN